MKKGVFLLINVMLISFLSESFSQNSLWLMNGKKLTIGNYEIIQNEDENIINYYNEKGKYKSYEIEDVFLLIKKDNEEEIFHKPDFLPDTKITADELRSFVQGQQDARKYYKDNLAFISSFPFGFVSVFYPPVSKVFFFPLYPSAHVGLLGITSVDYELVEIDEVVYSDKFYVLGYSEAAKKKRIKNGLVGAGAGIITGVAVAFLIGY